MNPFHRPLQFGLFAARNSGKHFALILLFLYVLSPLPLRSAAEPYSLCITDPASDNRLITLPLEKDETFTIRYIHSVDHTPVFEVFEIDAHGSLALRATYFQMFGAGMGHIQGRGTLDFDGRWTWIRDIHQTLDSFVLRVGSPGVDHTILYRGREIPLSTRWAGKRVRFFIMEKGGE